MGAREAPKLPSLPATIRYLAAQFWLQGTGDGRDCGGPHSGLLPPCKVAARCSATSKQIQQASKASETTSYLPIQGSIILSPTLPCTNSCFTLDIASDNALRVRNLFSKVALMVPGYHLMPSR